MSEVERLTGASGLPVNVEALLRSADETRTPRSWVFKAHRAYQEVGGGGNGVCPTLTIEKAQSTLLPGMILPPNRTRETNEKNTATYSKNPRERTRT